MHQTSSSLNMVRTSLITKTAPDCIPDNVIGEYFNPHETNKALYNKYSSSQTYYYSNILSEIVNEKRTSTNITYEDTEFLCDTEEYMKRFYNREEFPGKMFTFKEYYFYHEDSPRIFPKHIEEMYAKWQDRKRDLVYKKLKALYNESFTSENSSSKEEDNKKSASGVTHFLLQISDYNPFSKNYYLRVQAKQQQHIEETKRKQKKNNSIRDISDLNHELSIMLNDMSNLSVISTLNQQQSPRLSTLYHPKKLKVNQSSEYSTHHNSNSNVSNSQSGIKFNFKKNKSKDKIVEMFNKKIDIKDNNYQSLKSQQKYRIAQKNSPKFVENKIQDTFGKTKSIFQISSNVSSSKKGSLILNSNSVHNSEKKGLNLNLKLSDKSKPAPRQGRISFQNKALKRYESEKKVITQSSSHKKMPSVGSKNQLNFQSLNKKSTLNPNNPVINTVSNFKQIPRQNSLRETDSLKFTAPIGTQGQEFSDKKMHRKDQVRFRSHKSEYSSASKLQPLRTTNSPAKNIYRVPESIKNRNSQISIKPKAPIHINTRKGPQLKLN